MTARFLGRASRRRFLRGSAAAGVGSWALAGGGTACAEAERGGIAFSSGRDQASLLELFTSQGCSSCPPADDWLGRLVKDKRLWDRLVPVAWHVDYWDRLGWRDPLGDVDHSQRQYAYRRAGRSRSVYTPGFFVNGLEWRGWFQRGSLPAGKGRVGKLEGHLGEDGRTLSLEFNPESSSDSAAADLVAHATLLGFGIVTDVTRGENGGRKLESNFAVLAHAEGAIVPGESADLVLPQPRAVGAKAFAIAAWVEDRREQRPVQAAASWFPRSWAPKAP